MEPIEAMDTLHKRINAMADACLSMYYECPSYFYQKAVLDCVATIRHIATGGTGIARHDPRQMEELERHREARENAVRGLPLDIED